MYRSVLVPLDGSPFAEQALPLGLTIARRTGAELQLLYVHHNLEADYPEHRFLNEATWMTEWKTRHETYLDRLANELRAAGAGSVSPYVLQGDVAGTIHKHVVEKGADLVVMTTHARGPVARMWVGGVADQLIRELPRPVLLVHPVEGTADLTREVRVKHILLPLDGTPLAEQIIEPAIALGETMEADYTLLRVIRTVAPVHYPARGALDATLPTAMREQLERTETEARRTAQDYLDAVAERLRARLLKVRCHVTDESQPAVAILEAARSYDADLISMQTHGRRGLSRLILGSVADKVLRGSPVPLLVQRPVATA
jgi:nucleotide-binding universal stress UspA family protein